MSAFRSCSTLKEVHVVDVSHCYVKKSKMLLSATRPSVPQVRETAGHGVSNIARQRSVCSLPPQQQGFWCRQSLWLRVCTSRSDHPIGTCTMEDKSGGLLKTSAKEAQDLTVTSKSPYFKSAAARQTSVLLLRNKTTHQHVLVTSLAVRSGYPSNVAVPSMPSLVKELLAPELQCGL